MLVYKVGSLQKGSHKPVVIVRRVLAILLTFIIFDPWLGQPRPLVGLNLADQPKNTTPSSQILKVTAL
jgi:hypothetical protein